MAITILGLGLQLTSPAMAATASLSPDAPRPDRLRFPNPRLAAVHARHVGDVDEVTFRFHHGLPQSIRDNYVETMYQDPSGRPVRVAGAQVLMIVFFGLTPAGSPINSRKSFSLPNVITAVRGGDDEGLVTFGLGVQKATSYSVTELTDPDRVVVDVRADFPTATRRVWLVDRHAVRTGHQPYLVPRQRPVPSSAPEAGALQALFAGPRPRDRAAGLRLVRSGTSGFRDLRIAGHIARVRLDGCHSGDSKVTVASEIAATLRQFPTVDWVKIYGPGGDTAHPGGNVDSIPTCLEP